MNANSNDTIMPAILVWGFWLATSAFTRGATIALAGWTKFAALLLAPLWLTYPNGLRPRSALKFAIGKPLQLIDGVALAKLVRTTNQTAAAQETNAPAPSQPPCPQCGKPMVSRTARRGPKIGSQFWGCSSYPECRGTAAA